MTLSSIVPLPSPDKDKIKSTILCPGVLMLEHVVDWGHQLITAANEIGGWEEVSAEKDGELFMRRSCFPVAASYDSRLRRYEDGLFAAITTCLEIYLKYNPHVPAQLDEPYTLLRYGTDDCMKDHVDVELGSLVPDAHYMLSIYLYIGGSFSGGGVVFPLHGTVFHPTAGTCLLVPSGVGFPHEVQPVTGGERYVVVTRMFRGHK